MKQKIKYKVRIAQYISMMTTQKEDKKIRQWRMKSKKNRITPTGYAFPEDLREWLKNKHQTANITELKIKG